MNSQEYRGRENYSARACVPALEIAKTLTAHDPRAEPLRHDRVPYVIVCGRPEAALITLVRQPDALLKVLYSCGVYINLYYISMCMNVIEFR